MPQLNLLQQTDILSSGVKFKKHSVNKNKITGLDFITSNKFL